MSVSLNIYFIQVFYFEPVVQMTLNINVIKSI